MYVLSIPARKNHRPESMSREEAMIVSGSERPAVGQHEYAGVEFDPGRRTRQKGEGRERVEYGPRGLST